MGKLFGLLIILSFGMTSKPVFAQGDVLAKFRLEDQNGRMHNSEDFADQMVILFASDKDGSRYNERWISRIDSMVSESELNGSLSFVGVATLNSVPSFLRAFVRRRIRKSQTESILLDWQGEIHKLYELEKDEVNILVFDRSHRLVHKTSVTEFDEHEFDRIKDVLLIQSFN